MTDDILALDPVSNNPKSADRSHSPKKEHIHYDKRLLQDLPEKPGIYMMKNRAGDVIYVGKAINLKNRVRQYFQSAKNQTIKTHALVTHIDAIETIVVSSELEALILECNLIKKYRPKYNILLKDGKTYPYIGVSLKESYPRVFLTREKKKDGTHYFGPFTSSFAVKKTIEAIARLFPIQSCTRKTEPGSPCGRPCLNYHIGRCCGPCTGTISKEEYDSYIDSILKILEGNADDLLGEIHEKMLEASANLDFETAAELRDQFQGIQHIIEKQKIISESRHDQDLIAVHKDRELACVQILNIRQGQLIGRDQIFTDDVLEENEEEILTAFLKQYYMNQAFIPKEIILNHRIDPEEIEPIQAWLSEMKGSKSLLTFPQRGKKTKLAEMAEENARLGLEQYKAQRLRKVEKESGRTKALKDLLKLDNEPVNIEAYDISNIAGTHNVGGMVVFRQAKPDKKSYRRFKIESVDGQDDYASMQEMIFRRIERGIEEEKSGTKKSSFLPFPDIMAIDGGKKHVDAVKSILDMYPQLNIEVIGLVKDDHHKIRGVIYEDEEYPLKFATPLSSFLSDISEEVHRFAVSYHRQLRKKSMLESRLEEIPGIGKKRRETIMRQFGTVKNIENATVDEISALPGISRTIAENVFTYFHEENHE